MRRDYTHRAAVQRNSYAGGYLVLFSRPNLADQRRRNASKGGKTGGRGRRDDEVQKIKDWLKALTGGVLNDKIETGKAYAINALLKTGSLCVWCRLSRVASWGFSEALGRYTQGSSLSG